MALLEPQKLFASNQWSIEHGSEMRENRKFVAAHSVIRIQYEVNHNPSHLYIKRIVSLIYFNEPHKQSISLTILN